MASWLRKLFGRCELADDPVASETMAVTNVPELSEPILLFMESPAFVETLESVPSWEVVHVKTTLEFNHALGKGKYAILIALSPDGHAGSSGAAIERFRQRNPSALTVYHGYDYRLIKSARYALQCGADVLLVGGISQASLVYCLGTAYLLKQRVDPEPSYELYENLLKLTCPDSPFWQMQKTTLPESGMY